MELVNLDLIETVNRCQVAEMERIGKELNPQEYGAGEQFARQVERVQAAIVHTYQVVAFAAFRQSDPKAAAMLWQHMSSFCDLALGVLKTLKDRYAHCGTPELYDLTLDYKIAADKRFHQNLEDSEWNKCPPPTGLFPKMS